jgi:hypothetical protein
MSSNDSDTLSAADPYRLHYRQGEARCVTSYDTLEAALESAGRKLAKRPDMELWISDAGKQVLLDGTAIRNRLGQGVRGEAASSS